MGLPQRCWVCQSGRCAGICTGTAKQGRRGCDRTRAGPASARPKILLQAFLFFNEQLNVVVDHPLDCLWRIEKFQSGSKDCRLLPLGAHLVPLDLGPHNAAPQAECLLLQLQAQRRHRFLIDCAGMFYHCTAKAEVDERHFIQRPCPPLHSFSQNKAGALPPVWLFLFHRTFPSFYVSRGTWGIHTTFANLPQDRYDQARNIRAAEESAWPPHVSPRRCNELVSNPAAPFNQ